MCQNCVELTERTRIHRAFLSTCNERDQYYADNRHVFILPRVGFSHQTPRNTKGSDQVQGRSLGYREQLKLPARVCQ